MKNRPPQRIMLAVWKALFLREAGMRLFGSRGAWVWLFLEPMLHLAFITFLFSVIRQREVSGIDVPLFLILGLAGFFMFRRSASQMGSAIAGNRALFTYRQVTPFDPIIVRGFLEAGIMMTTLVLALFGLALFEFNVIPEQALRMLMGYGLIWLLGAGLGLVIAIAGEVVSETERIFGVLMLPLYILSGVIFPLSIVPYEYLPILLANPIPHGLETIRMAFSPDYRSVPGIELSYLVTWIVGFWATGLVLYFAFSKRVVAE